MYAEMLKKADEIKGKTQKLLIEKWMEKTWRDYKMLPADDIVINCLLGGTVGSIYIATLCFLWPILINADLIPPIFKPMRREEDSFNCRGLYETH